VATAAGILAGSPMGARRFAGRSLWRGCDGGSECVGLLSRCGPGHGEGSESFCERVDRQPDDADFHQSVRYGLTRKREQYTFVAPSGSAHSMRTATAFGDSVTITGANGYSVNGQALLDYPSFDNPYLSRRTPARLESRSACLSGRLQLYSAHVTGMVGFHYEDERGALPKQFTYLAGGAHQLRLPGRGAWGLQEPVLLHAGRQPGALLAVRNADFAARGATYYVLRPRKGSSAGRACCSTLAMRCASRR
jgi:hypothetical protein